jgi:hypothetical protein
MKILKFKKEVAVLEKDKEFILKKVIIPVYENLICCDEFARNEFELSLPLFLNTGDAVDIIIKLESEDKVVLKNRLHLVIEGALKEKINFINLRKNYLSNNDKIKAIEKSYIIDNGINNTLLQEKVISYSDIDTLREDIFLYLFSVIRYYNYVYDYVINNLKPEDRKRVFSAEIERFVKYYNLKNKLNLDKIDKLKEENSNLASDNNEYYVGESKLLTGVNNKVHFLEAVRDIDILKDRYKIEKIVIVQNKNGKNGISEKYMQKFLNAEFEYFSDNLELDFKEEQK